MKLARRLPNRLVKEGVIIRQGRNGKPEVVILGFIPADERKLSFNFVFALSLTVIGIAERHGGRAYSTGLYSPRRSIRYSALTAWNGCVLSKNKSTR